MDDSPSFEQRLQQAKLDALKELAYGASHEINNPLANIAARAQTLLRDEPDPDRHRALEAIRQQALRAHEMISDLMLFARPPQLVRQPLDLAATIQRVFDELSSEAARREIELTSTYNQPLPLIDADPVQLSVALKALCQNALDAIGRQGRIQVAASIPHDPDGEPRDRNPAFLRLVVADDGPGVSMAVRPHMFDPFFSGREAGRGLGFGLSKAWRIVEQHGGRLYLEDSAGLGATFVLELPLCSP